MHSMHLDGLCRRTVGFYVWKFFIRLPLFGQNGYLRGGKRVEDLAADTLRNKDRPPRRPGKPYSGG